MAVKIHLKVYDLNVKIAPTTIFVHYAFEDV